MTKNILPIIFNVQRFSIHDGPGIRTTVFTKGCPLSCVWCQNPESQKPRAEIAYYSEDCIKCNACVEICPTNAIDSESYISDYQKCSLCLKCIEVCKTNSRRLIGDTLSIDEITNTVLKDIDFYETSGGGVTLSGGEPLMYPDKVLPLLKEFKEKGLSIYIETSGFFNLKLVKPLLEYIDVFYYDLKLMDNMRHINLTGVSNKAILSNFEYLASQSYTVVPRLPLIPDINNDMENMKATASFLSKNKINQIHILPFNKMGNSKIPRIDTDAKVFEKEYISKEEYLEIIAVFQENSIEVIGEYS